MSTIGRPESDPRTSTSSKASGSQVESSAREAGEPGVERLLSEHSQGHAVRVILVGKTGLDAKLRLAPEYEVIRVRSPMEAIGELAASLPGDAASVVIVGDEAGSVSTHPEVAMDFARGVRTVIPTVQILRTAAPGVTIPAAYDGTIHADMSAEEIRARLMAEPGDQPVATTLAPERPALSLTPAMRIAPKLAEEDQPPIRVEVPSGVTGPEIGDEEVARALVMGQDVTQVATSVLRRRLGDSSVAFSGGVRGAERGGEATVAWEGTVYGVLRAAAVPSAKLVRAAEWLASWMRLADQHNALKNAAFTDSLTGAFNRRYFDKFLESAIAQAREERRSVTVLAFDLDDFKKYNDAYGHDTGDEILRETVRLLKSVVRPTDRVCRIGGDEFAVIFHEPQGPRESGSRHPQSIFAIADRFQRQVSEQKFPKLVDAPGPLSISGGLATFPWDGTTAAELLTRADQLALESKRQGKNVITIGR